MVEINEDDGSVSLHQFGQVQTCASAAEVGVVGGRRDAHGARAAAVHVTQLERDRLQIVRRELVVVVQHVVMRRLARPLQTHLRSDPINVQCANRLRPTWIPW